MFERRLLRQLLFLLLFLASVWPQDGFAQAQGNKRDSLSALLYAKKGIDRLPVLNALPEFLVHDHPDEALLHIREAEALATAADDREALAAVLFNYGRYYHAIGRMDSTLLYMHRSRSMRERSTAPGTSTALARTYNGLGATHGELGRSDSAVHYYLKAIAHLDPVKDLDILSSTYSNLGLTHLDQQKNQDAIVYLRRALAIDKAAHRQEDAAKTMSNLGGAFLRIHQLDSALHYHQEALAIRKATGNLLEEARSLNNLGTVYREMGMRREADDHYRQSLAIKRSVGNAYEVARSLNNIGMLYNEMGRSREAIDYLREAIRITDTLSAPQIRMRTYTYMATSYAKLRNFELAYACHLTADSIHAIIATEERDERFASLMAQYESAEKEKQILALEQEQERAALESTTLRQRSYLLIAGLAIVVMLGLTILGGFLLISSRNRKLASLNKELADRNAEIAGKNEEIQQQAAILASKNDQILAYNTDLERIVAERTANLLRSNAELDTFLYQSSHSLRGPLMRIKGLMEILRNENKHQPHAILFEKVDYTIALTDRMLHKLMDAAEIHRHALSPSAVDVRAVVRSLVEDINERMAYPSSELRTDLPDKPLPVADHFLFTTILNNLIENALHFRQPGRPHTVEVQLEQKGQEWLLRVRDNGMGIPEAELPNLGSMFHRATPRSAGMGLGLYVIRIALERIGGRLEVDSQEGLFTESRVLIPVVDRMAIVQARLTNQAR